MNRVCRHMLRRMAENRIMCKSSDHLQTTLQRRLEVLSKSSSTFFNNRRSYNVGLFGAGRIARTHVSNILRSRRLNLAWIVDEQESQIQALRDHFRVNTPGGSLKDADRFLADDSLDGVLICTPASSHAELIIKCLQKGKAVFTEKPTTESVADTRACYEAAENAGKPLLTGYTRRFDETLADVVDAAASGVVGRLQLIKLTTRDSPKTPFRMLDSGVSTGCNILADLGIHDIDYLVWMTHARRPESVYVSGHAHDLAMKDARECDILLTQIKYPDGLLAILDTCRVSSYGYDIRAEVYGPDGMVCAENPRPSQMTINNNEGTRMRTLHYSYPQRLEAAFAKELDHFVKCLDGTAMPLVTKEECITTAEILEHATESYKQSKVIYF